MPARLRIMFLIALTVGLYLGMRALWRRIRRDERTLPTGASGSVRKVTYHDNGRMKSERYLLDGVMHGPWMLWDEAGNKLAEGHHKHGMLDGLEVRYGGDGQKLSETRWVEGRRHGTATSYAPDGAVAGQLCYIHAEDQAEPAHEGPCTDAERDTPKPD